MGRSLGGSVLLILALAGAAPLGAQNRPRDRGGERTADTVPERPDGRVEAGQRRDELARAAAGIRAAWLAHDAATIVAGSPQLVVQLPGADPSAALGARQAAALLASFLAAAREVELVVREAREVEPGRGYVELLRRYQVNGTQDVRAQNLFLGYRRGRQGWVLVELRAIEP